MSKHRVAVLGGGMAALTAALRLSDTPELRDRYQIDVYQMGWRLGGKGASGRDVDGGTWRNEEHGLHYLFGFYENAFQVLRSLYKELPEDWPWDIDDALKPGRGPIIMYENGDYGVEPWPMLWGGEANGRRDNGVPGDGVEIPLTPLEAAKAALWQAAPNLADALADHGRHDHIKGGHRSYRTGAGDFDMAGFCGDARVDDQTHQGQLHREFAAAHQHVESGAQNAAIAALETALGTSGALLRAGAEGSMDRRRQMLLAQFFNVTALGVLKDLGRGSRKWFDLDAEDFRAWLRRHGADDELANAPFVDAIYNSSFATTFAAGTVLHAIFNCIVRCKGHLFYKMQAGMGDVIFAPFYRVLKDRGVQFHFFHRVENLGLAKNRRRIKTIDIDIQAIPTNGHYEPLVINPRDDLPCWPSRPDVSQLENPPEDVNFENWWDRYHVGKIRLSKGEDFDSVILGIGIGAFKDICRELTAHDGRFYEMVEQVVTTETQAAQFWLNRSFQALATDLGDYRLPDGAPDPRPVGLPFAAPWLSWSDMSQLNQQEDVPDAVSQLYVCGAFPYRDQPPPRRPEFKRYPYERADEVKAGVHQYLSSQGGDIWPRAVVDGQFDERILVPFDQRNRFDAQYFIACMNPSDNYVLAVPGSNRYRMRAHETLYDNLYLAGDWTLNPMSFGCLESATMGGIGAAYALEPELVPRATYDWLPPETPRRSGVDSYIFRDGELISDPPVVCDVDLNFFLVPGSYDELNQLCERCLNIGPLTYRPLGLEQPFVVFYTASLFTCTGAGSYEERDFGMWVPIARYDAGMPVAFGTYSPYVWVNNSPALVGGRTVYGYPKQLGTLKLGSDPGAEGVFSVDGLVIPLQGGTMEEARVLEAVRVADSGDEERFEDEKQLVDLLAMMLDVEHHLDWRQLWQLYSDHGMRQVLLKQFLGANGRSAAVYQAIIEADMKITSAIEGGVKPGHYELGVLDSFSHQIVENLGLRWNDYRRTDRNAYYRVPVLNQGWMKFTATLETGQVVYRSI